MPTKRQKFEAILANAEEIIRHDRRGLHELVKTLCLTTLSDFISWRLSSTKYPTPLRLEWPSVFFPRAAKLDSAGRTLDDLCPDNGERPRIRLGQHPIIAYPWNHRRLVRSLALIGPDREWGKWKHDKFNHLVEWWRPLGIAWVLNGNHSITTGVIRGEGSLTPRIVRDITPLYDCVRCDGERFIRLHDGKTISRVTIPEMAAVFEIGRMMIAQSSNAISAAPNDSSCSAPPTRPALEFRLPPNW